MPACLRQQEPWRADYRPRHPPSRRESISLQLTFVLFDSSVNRGLPPGNKADSAALLATAEGLPRAPGPQRADAGCLTEQQEGCRLCERPTPARDRYELLCAASTCSPLLSERNAQLQLRYPRICALSNLRFLAIRSEMI